MTNQTVVEVLQKARQLIEDKENWWGYEKRDNMADMSTHCSLQAIGLSLLLVNDPGPLYVKAKQALANAIKRETTIMNGMAYSRIIMTFNDTHPHHEVLAAFDRAIIAEGEKNDGSTASGESKEQ